MSGLLKDRSPKAGRLAETMADWPYRMLYGTIFHKTRILIVITVKILNSAGLMSLLHSKKVYSF
jgi:hypothetical protein